MGIVVGGCIDDAAALAWLGADPTRGPDLGALAGG